ncbi:MAG: 3-phosphoserine/phosphohydroxythreonine transaminase [Myxococcales bacterium]|nr:3-phosphoserine/phosphohydroxythreonine transaminase [Polyangiaceae bacterium]MDW8248385.1 3-phosphoserine/phosphohydroxythreonine transaminase [Myxococcales bacterium]
MANRVHNFNPGPAALPLPALLRAQEELLDFAGTGMSILEHSHRGKEYEAVHQEALGLIRSLLAVPESHQILLLQGGAHHQFAMIPMNFLRPGQRADYLITGSWGERALEEAQIVGHAREAASTRQDGTFRRTLRPNEIPSGEGAAYVHYTTNETIHGVQFHHTPEVKAPLIADMSSDLFSRPLEVARFDLIYAGAQKNIGPSGVTVVIGRKSFLDGGRTDIPKYFRYTTHAAAESLYNTAPTFAIYLVRNVLSWLEEQGGVAAIARQNEEKASLLYRALDEDPDFFRVPVERDSRSRMNVVFRLPTEALEDRLVHEAKKRSLMGIKGHRSVGGIRVSLYNAVSLASVEILAQFLRDFRTQAWP